MVEVSKNFSFKKRLFCRCYTPFEHDGRVFYTNHEKASAFNEVFVEQSSIEDSNDDNIPRVPMVPFSINHIELSVDEVKNVLKDLNPTKAVGSDIIHNEILITSRDVIVEALTILFNISLQEGVFPTIWKTAHVTPIYKKGSKELSTNYRPISLLSCINKVLEKCVQRHVLHYLNGNHLITPSQSGFIAGGSTVCQLLCVYNDFCKFLDKGATSQAIFLDISKAFDKVWHRGLLKKLDTIGIRGQLLVWFSDYLSNRKQAVVLAGSKSDYLTTIAGVPQGSVLGPLLFLIYVNDIDVNIESIMKLFADDTSLYLCLDNPYIRAEILNSDLEKILDWAETWKVVFSQPKNGTNEYFK